MEIANLILTAISTVVAIVSAILAVSAKNEVKKLKNQINGNDNVQNSGKISVSNKGNNQGVISGINTGEIRQWFIYGTTSEAIYGSMI